LRPFFVVLLAIILLAPCAAVRSAHAQQRPEPGERVRITVPGVYTNFAATFLGVEGDSLRLLSRRLEIAVPVASVTSIERSASRRPRFIGVLVGAVGGAAAGWVVGSFMGLCDTVDSEAPDSGGCVPLMIGSFAAGGGLTGLLYAVTNPNETWEPTSLPPAMDALRRLSLSVDPELGTTFHVAAFQVRF